LDVSSEALLDIDGDIVEGFEIVQWAVKERVIKMCL